MDTEIMYAVIGMASGVVFGNLLPFPKHIWDKITMAGGVSLASCIGWIIFKAVA